MLLCVVVVWWFVAEVVELKNYFYEQLLGLGSVIK